jgi:hypothetical protein
MDSPLPYDLSFELQDPNDSLPLVPIYVKETLFVLFYVV